VDALIERTAVVKHPGNGYKKHLDASHRRKEIWKALVDEGGYWSAEELCRLMPERDAGKTYSKTGVVRLLHNMVRDGCVVAKPNRYGVETYGVTILCGEPE
jgi:Fe2+ or Zn2+ uptake regulation protein